MERDILSNPREDRSESSLIHEATSWAVDSDVNGQPISYYFTSFHIIVLSNLNKALTNINRLLVY